MLDGLSFRRVAPCKDSRESDALVGEILEQTDERMRQKVKDLRPRNSKEYILNNFEKR